MVVNGIKIKILNSIKNIALEEAYEVIEAIENNDNALYVKN